MALPKWCCAALCICLSSLAAPAGDGLVDGSKLKAVFDQTFSSSLTFTGAVAVVVQDGRVLFLKGYGYENAARSVPVDPARTRFRIGSVTKTMTAVAIGQLLDSGTIQSIDDPANRYLKSMKLPPNQGTEITLRMLATHQAGFAELRQPFLRLGDPPPTRDSAYYRDNLPPYLRPVNSGANYSNYGISVLGLVARDLTGMSFEEYLKRRILDPAGMKATIDVIEPRAHPGMAQAQAFYPDGSTVAIPDDWSLNPIIEPAGALASTGADMSRYMIALLGGSPEMKVQSLCSDRTRGLLMSRLDATHPWLQGYGVAFMLNNWNGQKLVEHGGRTLGATSYMTLIPESRLGVFVAVTGEPGLIHPALEWLGVVPRKRTGPRAPIPLQFPSLIGLRAGYLEALLGRYLPPAKPRSTTADLGEYAGDYRGERREKRSVTTFFSTLFFGGGLQVKPDGRGGLQIGSRPGYLPIAKDVFWSDPATAPKRPSGWYDIFVFRRDAAGRVTGGSFLYADVVYGKIPSWSGPARNIQLALAACMVLLTGLFSPLWSPLSRGRIASPAMAALLMALPVLFFLCWPNLHPESLSYVSIRAQDLIPFQIAGNLTGVLALYLIGCPWYPRGRSRGWRGWLAIWHPRLLALASLVLLWAFWNLDLLGWNVA